MSDLITIDELPQSLSSNGEELLPAWQNETTVSLPMSSLNPFRGENNTTINQPKGGIILGCNNTLSGGVVDQSNAILAAQYGYVTGSDLSVVVGGLRNTIERQVGSVIISSQSSNISGKETGTPGNENFIAGSNQSSITGRNAFNAIIASGQAKINQKSGNDTYAYIQQSGILGGNNNTIYGQNNVIIGGSRNTTGSDSNASASFYGANAISIGGGPIFNGVYPSTTAGNRADSTWSVTIGGICNTARQVGSVIIGGSNNCTESNISFLPTGAGFIIGGNNNCVKSSHTNTSIINGTGMTTVSSDMLHTTRLYLSAAALPTTDPGIAGVVWRDGTDLKISV